MKIRPGKYSSPLTPNYLHPLAMLFTLVIALVISCTGPEGKKNNSDTPTSGHVKVGADDSYQNFMDAEKMVFEELYVDAKVDVITASEDSIIKLLMADSIRFAVLSRKLTAAEESVIKKNKVDPTYIRIAFDGVALIVHPENPVKGLSLSKLKKIFRGEIISWKKLDSLSKSDSIRIVFDNQGSGNARYIKDSLLGPDAKFPSNCFASSSNPEVIKYVSTHKNALGVIGANWISDSDDSLAQTFLKDVVVMGISSPWSPDLYYQPYQAYIAQGNYPLFREVYIVKREVGAGLGTGFAAFIAGEKGQRIILKSGLVPSTMPITIVDVKSE